MDLPADVLLELPRITVVGDVEIVIENHRGIHKYTSEEVCLRLKDSLLSISGKRLTIKFLEKNFIKLEGKINGIAFLNQ